MKPDQERVRGIIHNTIISLCENGLKFDRHLRIEGVIGVTTDEQEIFIIHINESLNADSCSNHPFPGGRPSGVAPSGGAPKPIMRRPSDEEALLRAKPPLQFSPNSSMGFRGAVRGSPRMGLRSPRMGPSFQLFQVPGQRTPLNSPRNALRGMPRLERFSPESRLKWPIPHSTGKLGLSNSPSLLTKEVSGDPNRTLPQKQLFSAELRRNSSCQFPQINESPCKLEKVDVILVDDDDQVELDRSLRKSEGDKAEDENSTGHIVPDLEPETSVAGSASQVGPEGDEAGNNTETEIPGQCEPNVEAQSTSASIPGCSGIIAEAPEKTDQDEKCSTLASADNSSLTSFDVGFSLDRPFNPEDYASGEDETEDMSFSDLSDEDWDDGDDQDTMSDPDWSDKTPRKKKARVTPKKTGTPGGSVSGQKQAANVPSQCQPNLIQKFGRFAQVPQHLLHSGNGEEDSWKLVARFVCNISGCNASFSQKYNLKRHQRAKHGFGKASKSLSRSLMHEADQADT